MTRWRAVERTLRYEIENFCRERAEKIVRALRPQRIAVIGTGTYDWLTDEAGAVVLRSNGRVLIKEGELWGSPAIGLIHLSGARISAADRALIQAYVRALSSPTEPRRPSAG